MLSLAPLLLAFAGPPLQLDDVLDAVGDTHPQLEAADRDVDEADGNALAARGGFDPTLAIGTKWTPVGFYNNGQTDAVVRQPTPAWGIGLHAGYRIGWGAYPVYRGDLQTLSGGEIRAGIDIPLWRDGPIDSRRAAIKQAKIRRGAAGKARDAKQLELERDAAKAYWTWAETGQRLRVARELLAIAERRDAGLNEQAAAGTIERIKVVDNRRLVLERMSKVVEAERAFEQAAVALSLFLRDDAHKPVRPTEDRVPDTLPDPQRVDVPSLAREVDRAAQSRPDVAVLEAERQAKKVEVRLARNQRAPKINVQTFVAKDLGDGPAELGPVEWGAGVVFEMPLALRKARGEYRAAKARLASVDARLRGLRDRVGAEIRTALVALRAAEQSVVLARQQMTAADELAGAEREKFTEGASDLVVVNLRELAAADAALLEIDALADYQRAHADLMVALGRRPNS